jgi:preprotein translocase subunit SecG
MDNAILIRVVAGVCFALVLGIMIQRRRKKAA